MVAGALGEIVFEVSEQTIRTAKNVTWSGSARWAVHQRHGGHALTEFAGLDPDKMSLTIQLSAYLGVSPMKELEKLWRYERMGEAVSLVLGEKIYGKYRWSVLSHKTTMEKFEGGNLSSCSVDVELQEYLPGAGGASVWG